MQRVGVSPGDVLDQLRRLSAELAGRFLWLPQYATAFVLTDEVPPLVIRSGRRILTFTPEVQDERVLHSAFADDDGEAIARMHRQGRSVSRRRSPKRAAVRAFAESRRERGDTWPAIQVEWNRAQPREWHYTTHEGLRRACKDAD